MGVVNKIINRVVRGIRALVGWLQNLPYKKMARAVLDKLGTFFHWMLFDVLMPTKLQNLTKKDVYTIIFKADTPAGKRFDLWLLVAIVLNIIVLVLESLVDVTVPLPGSEFIMGTDVSDSIAPLVEEPTHTASSHPWVLWMLKLLGWMFTILFTFEYYLRIWCLQKPMRYVTSFYGIIDLLSIIPPYLSLLFPFAQSFTVLRLLRLMRVFRVLDMKGFMQEGKMLFDALKRSATKVLIFMLFVYIAAIILGTMMYAIEGEKNPGINSIPSGIYWAVVTITTVGYGDLTPVTPTGRFLSVVVMILGYAIIAVPTGIVAGETINEHQNQHHKARRRRRLEGQLDEEEEQID